MVDYPAFLKKSDGMDWKEQYPIQKNSIMGTGTKITKKWNNKKYIQIALRYKLFKTKMYYILNYSE